LTDNVAFSSVHRFLGERSRAESSRDDNFRRLCSSLVGANGRSPEGGLGWNLCLLREKGTIGAGQSLFLLLSSRERSERLKFDLSQLFKAFSVQRFFGRDPAQERCGMTNWGISVQALHSRHPDNAPGQDPCPSRLAGLRT